MNIIMIGVAYFILFITLCTTGTVHTPVLSNHYPVTRDPVHTHTHTHTQAIDVMLVQVDSNYS